MITINSHIPGGDEFNYLQVEPVVQGTAPIPATDTG